MKAILNFSESEKWTTRVSFSSGKAPVNLPRILICSFNRFSKEKLRQYNLSDDFVTYMFTNFMAIFHEPVYDPEVLSNGEWEYREFANRTNMNFMEIVETLGMPCPIATIQMAFRGHISSCAPSENETMWFTVRKVPTSEFGFCYQIEFDESVQTVTRTGK